MSETYDLYQQGREHLAAGHAAQATVPLRRRRGASRRRRPSGRRSASPTSASAASPRRRRSCGRCWSSTRSAATRARPWALPGEAGSAGRGRRALPPGELLPAAEPRLPAGARQVRELGAACGRSSSGSPRRASRRRGGRGRDRPRPLRPSGHRRRATTKRSPSASPARSRACGSSRTRRAGSTAASSTSSGGALLVSQFTLIADTAQGQSPQLRGRGAAPEPPPSPSTRVSAKLFREAPAARSRRGSFGAR